MCGLLIEPLEVRRFLSVSVPTTAAPAAPAAATNLNLASSTSRETATATATASDVVLIGTTINAIETQAFRAVIGTIRGLGPLPGGYTLHGDINWGDGTAASEAKFLRQSDGSIAVLGDHTYATVGTDDITVVVEAVPPPWSEAPVLLIGTFHSKANVIAANGGVTLQETADAPFTARVGFFRSTVNPATMTAVIEWGDGTQSPGKIEPLPTAGPIPSYAVVGSHAYSATGSYLLHVTVYSSSPPPASPPAVTPPVYLVAKFDSVIDVLPHSPSATSGIMDAGLEADVAVTDA